MWTDYRVPSHLPFMCLVSGFLRLRVSQSRTRKALGPEPQLCISTVSKRQIRGSSPKLLLTWEEWVLELGLKLQLHHKHVTVAYEDFCASFISSRVRQKKWESHQIFFCQMRHFTELNRLTITVGIITIGFEPYHLQTRVWRDFTV